MRHVLRTTGAAFLAVFLLATGASAQTNTPTSFQGGPDASVTTVLPAGPSGTAVQGGGTATETATDDDGDSSTRWLAAGAVLVVVLGIALLAFSRQRPRRDPVGV